MRTSKFYTWLVSQAGRGDPVGDLARDVDREARGGRLTSCTESGIKASMASLQAPSDAYSALSGALTEFKEKKNGL